MLQHLYTSSNAQIPNLQGYRECNLASGRKLSDRIVREEGIQITDANGNGLGKVEVTDAEGNITEEVAVVKLGSEISEEAADLLTRLRNRLKNDYKWTDEEILAFERDFKGDLELLRRFDGDEGLVDAWSLIKNAPDAVKRNPKVLSKIDEFSKGSSGISSDKITEAFESDLGDILAKASDGDLDKILGRFDMSHMNDGHLDEICPDSAILNTGSSKIY